MSSLIFAGKQYKSIIIKIAIEAPFKEILKKINELRLPLPEAECEPIRFAVLELVNNSLRAHRERNVQEEIKLEYRIEEERLWITLTDGGGGFDLQSLPYDLSLDPQLIDVNSDRFQEYREKNQYQKFGMGLLSGKKVFPRFEITFYDDEGIKSCWIPERTKGTIIRMGMDYHNE